MCAEPLRFSDELVRHKILDLVGDIMLLGKPIKAHLIAMRAGHALHADLTKALLEQVRSNGIATG
jgi:UDP-3-O-[3-hydroxymyristoyl] N-acetylglucosamine deacetylase / 3-hydroxyacyl-[acyl-carrier-protein] dehydratase